MAQRQPCIIHVGFANTGTTSLQQNFFAQREDIFYIGQPYGERGGIFTFIRHAEDFKYDETQVSSLCDHQIFCVSQGRKIVISDEMLCDSPQLYYAPYMALAADMIFDDEFFDFYSGLQQRLGQEQLEELLDAGDRAAAGLEPEDLADLRRRVAAANRQLAEEYDVDLERYGYALGEGGAASGAADSAASPQLVGELNERFAGEREASVSPVRQLASVRRPLPKINGGLRHWFNLARSFGK